jgi:REP element-mobilizing transposase RayT
LLTRAEAYGVLERELATVRLRYGFVVAGYVLAPEHVHLLGGEPRRSSLSVALQVLKQQTSCRGLRINNLNVMSERRILSAWRMSWSSCERSTGWSKLFWMSVADARGSNARRSRLWKVGLQRLSNLTGLHLHVSHLPPGTGKWNKIEHRMFSFITQNGRARPLVSYPTVVDLISNTKTKTGLKIKAKLAQRTYPT